MITVGDDGIARAVRVGIAMVDGKLWSSGTQDRARTRRLRQNPNCTLFVFDNTWSYLTLETTVRLLEGPDVPALSERLFRIMQNRPTGPLSWFGGEMDSQGAAPDLRIRHPARLQHGVMMHQSPMDEITKKHWDNLWSRDRRAQNAAYFAIIEATDKPVDWAYDVWDDAVANLGHADNHNRAIAAQVLCNLAKSDPQQRMLKDFDRLLAVTRDERFVTARHCLQALWKVGVAGPKQRALLLDGLERRFAECAAEKNRTLIRYDILQSLRDVYDATGDESVKAAALALIEMEGDLKYRKKYASVWKAKRNEVASQA
jgi:hypothetical protein